MFLLIWLSCSVFAYVEESRDGEAAEDRDYYQEPSGRAYRQLYRERKAKREYRHLRVFYREVAEGSSEYRRGAYFVRASTMNSGSIATTAAPTTAAIVVKRGSL